MYYATPRTQGVAYHRFAPCIGRLAGAIIQLLIYKSITIHCFDLWMKQDALFTMQNLRCPGSH